MSAELQQVTTAIAEFDRVIAGLSELKSRYGSVVYDVATSKGMDDAKAARLALRQPRYEIEQIRKGAKAPILALGKKLDSEAARITAEIMAIEGPIDEQIKNEEARKEAERQAKIEAERKRVEQIQQHIGYIRNLPIKGAGKTSAHAQSVLTEAEEIVVNEEFAEFADDARAALTSALAALKGIVAERQAHEAEQARIKAEREELARLRAEEEKRQAAERARIAEEERQAKAARDAEMARQAAELKAAREKQEAEAASERKRIADEEAASKAVRDAETKRLAEERAEIERQQEELRKAQEPIVLETSRPKDQEIIDLIAEHWGVDEATVVEWILSMDLSTRSIAA